MNMLLVKLKARYGERPMPKVSIVDLREELKKAGNRSILSRELWGADRKKAGKPGTDHALSEQKRLCRFCVLQGVRPCDEMSPL